MFNLETNRRFEVVGVPGQGEFFNSLQGGRRGYRTSLTIADGEGTDYRLAINVTGASAQDDEGHAFIFWVEIRNYGRVQGSKVPFSPVVKDKVVGKVRIDFRHHTMSLLEITEHTKLITIREITNTQARINVRRSN